MDDNRDPFTRLLRLRSPAKPAGEGSDGSPIYVRDGEVKTAIVGRAQQPSGAELPRRDKLKREGERFVEGLCPGADIASH